MLTMPAWDLRALLTTLFALYVAGVAIFIILDNRSPQSTFAWLFLLVSLPVVGLLVYIFFGRSWHAFSGRSLSQQIVGSELNQALMPLMARHAAIMQRIAKEKPESYNRNLLNLIANNSGSILTEFNQVEVLQDAHAMYPRLLEDLRRAQSSIHLEFYIWTNDEFTQQVKDVLIERAQAGVRVHALYDAFTGRAMGKAYRNELLAGGVDIRPYLAHKRLRSLHNIQYRNHRKITVIDGKIGYVGGMNLDKEQLSGPKGFSAWRDTHLRIHGEAALALQASFVVSWHNSTLEKLTDSVYFPIDEIRREVTEFTPVQIAQSGPDSQWSGLRQLYFFLIMAANRSIRIQSPFFIPDESISEALKSAALAGVDVRMIFQPRRRFVPTALSRRLYLLRAMARAGAPHLPLSERHLFPPQDDQHRRGHLLGRLGQYGHPQFQHQLRDQRRHLRPGYRGRIGARLRCGPGTLHRVQPAGIRKRRHMAAFRRLALSFGLAHPLARTQPQP